MTRAGWIHGSTRHASFRPTVRAALPGVLAALSVLALGGCTPSSPGEEPGAARERGPGAAAAALREPTGVLLARPADEGDEESNSSVRVLLDLVRRTPAGARIRLVGHSFSLVPVAEALAEAHRRGVQVQVITDRSVSGEWQAPGLLRRELGTDRRRPSYIHLAPGHLHQKIWTFTRAAGVRDVSLVGSMNLTYRSARQYTDVRTWAGRRDVRRVLDRQFVLLRDRLPRLPATPPLRAGGDRLWFFPGYDLATDPVRCQLEAVPARGARIRVAMYAWLDERGMLLARLLADKAAQGARVEVVLGRSVGPQVRQVLVGSAVVVRDGVYADGDDIHHKLAVVSHAGADGVRRRFVLTGSDNWTTRSLRRPELLLRLEPDRRTFARYVRWVDRLSARAAREAARR